MFFLLVAFSVFACLLKALSDKELDALSVESIEIVSPKISRSVRIVFLSDLHDKEFGKNNIRLINRVRKIKPELIVIGGDTMIVREGKIDLKVTDRLLSNLIKIAPVFYGNGNNEQRLTWERDVYEKYRKQFHYLLKKYNIGYLDDTSEVYGDLRISGLNIDLCHYKGFRYSKLTSEYIEKKVGSVDSSKYSILLCHSPMFLDTYEKWGADLVLAGHSHGGVIRFPTDRNKKKGRINNDRGLVSGQYQLFHKYCAGAFWKNDCCMIVSRGLGTHTINVRINNLPQVVVINIKPRMTMNNRKSE